MSTPSQQLSNIRLAVISACPVPYKSPVWRHLYSNMGIDLMVFYPALDGAKAYQDPLFGKTITWDIPLLEGYPWTSVQNRPQPWLNWRFTYSVPDIRQHLADGGFTHMLLVGKEYAYYHQALSAARRLGLTTLYRAESHPAKTGWLAKRMATASRRRWYRHIDRFLCVGHYQCAEYAPYGIPQDRMVFSPYCVDNARFSQQRAHLLPSRDEIRRNYGFSPDTFVVGYSGKMYPRKNPLELIRAMARLPRHSQGHFGLLMVGDGVQRSEAEQLARSSLSLPVAFTGFLNQTELAQAYTAMDLFVMPSLWETWGLVLNEALVFGLPAIATTGVNAALDLITPERNGYTYTSGHDAALADLMHRVFQKTRQGEPMGEYSRSRIAAYSVEAACKGITQALQANHHNP